MNTLENFEKKQIENLITNKNHPVFYSGDTLKVHLKIKEGEKERIQIFEGICIAKKNSGINSSFTMRKISYGEGVERVLPLYSPQIAKIEIAKSGDVRRSKLYYLRNRSGKSARIAEKNKFIQANQSPVNTESKTVINPENVTLKSSDEEHSGNKKIKSEISKEKIKDSGDNKNP